MSDARSPPNEEETTRSGSQIPSDGGSEGTQGRLLEDQVRNATLRAQVSRLEEQRESLRGRVADLEAQVEELEAERATLETTLEDERDRRQQVIETYERILDEKEGCRDRDDKKRTPFGGALQYSRCVFGKIRSLPSRHL